MKTVLVTGSSSGIGREIVREMASAGWRVLMIARREEPLKNLQKEFPASLYYLADLSQPLSNQFQAWLSEHCQDLKALVNNAGAYRPQSLQDDEDATWDFHYQTNLMSAVRLTRFLWPLLLKSQASIVNISSTLAVRPIAGTAAYSALKGAMNNWTQSLALEGASMGLRANTIAPGIVDTPIHSYVGSEQEQDRQTYQVVQTLQPLARTGKPQDIAPLVRQLCEPASSWITGALIPVDGGILLKS